MARLRDTLARRDGGHATRDAIKLHLFEEALRPDIKANIADYCADIDRWLRDGDYQATGRAPAPWPKAEQLRARMEARLAKPKLVSMPRLREQIERASRRIDLVAFAMHHGWQRLDDTDGCTRLAHATAGEICVERIGERFLWRRETGTERRSVWDFCRSMLGTPTIAHARMLLTRWFAGLGRATERQELHSNAQPRGASLGHVAAGSRPTEHASADHKRLPNDGSSTDTHTDTSTAGADEPFDLSDTAATQKADERGQDGVLGTPPEIPSNASTETPRVMEDALADDALADPLLANADAPDSRDDQSAMPPRPCHGSASGVDDVPYPVKPTAITPSPACIVRWADTHRHQAPSAAASDWLKRLAAKIREPSSPVSHLIRSAQATTDGEAVYIGLYSAGRVRVGANEISLTGVPDRDAPDALAVLVAVAKLTGWTGVTLSGASDWCRAVAVAMVREWLHVTNPELRPLCNAERLRLAMEASDTRPAMSSTGTNTPFDPAVDTSKAAQHCQKAAKEFAADEQAYDELVRSRQGSKAIPGARFTPAPDLQASFQDRRRRLTPNGTPECAPSAIGNPPSGDAEPPATGSVPVSDLPRVTPAKKPVTSVNAQAGAGVGPPVVPSPEPEAQRAPLTPAVTPRPQATDGPEAIGTVNTPGRGGSGDMPPPASPRFTAQDWTRLRSGAPGLRDDWRIDPRVLEQFADSLRHDGGYSCIAHRLVNGSVVGYTVVPPTMAPAIPVPGTEHGLAMFGDRRSCSRVVVTSTALDALALAHYENDVRRAGTLYLGLPPEASDTTYEVLASVLRQCRAPQVILACSANQLGDRQEAAARTRLSKAHDASDNKLTLARLRLPHGCTSWIELARSNPANVSVLTEPIGHQAADRSQTPESRVRGPQKSGRDD